MNVLVVQFHEEVMPRYSFRFSKAEILSVKTLGPIMIENMIVIISVTLD